MDEKLIERARRLLGAGKPRPVSPAGRGPLAWLAQAHDVLEDPERTIVLRVHSSDAAAVRGFPPYVAHQLHLCGSAVVRSPTAVFRGLRPDGAPRLAYGLAIVGRPPQTTDQRGRAVPAPEGMVYVLFADQAGFVFDWDWMAADPNDPNVPEASQERFDHRIRAPKLELDLSGLQAGQFSAPLVSHSPIGDCVFCYISDTPSYAERVDKQVTVFRSYVDEKITGFKLKDAAKTRQWLVEIKGEQLTVHTKITPLLLAASLLTGHERHLPELLGRIGESMPQVSWRDEPIAASL